MRRLKSAFKLFDKGQLGIGPPGLGRAKSSGKTGMPHHQLGNSAFQLKQQGEQDPLGDHGFLGHRKLSTRFGVDPTKDVESANSQRDVGVLQRRSSALFPILDIPEDLKLTWLAIFYSA